MRQAARDVPWLWIGRLFFLVVRMVVGMRGKHRQCRRFFPQELKGQTMRGRARMGMLEYGAGGGVGRWHAGEEVKEGRRRRGDGVIGVVEYQGVTEDGGRDRPRDRDGEETKRGRRRRRPRDRWRMQSERMKQVPLVRVQLVGSE